MKNSFLAITLIAFLFGAVSCSDDDNNVQPSQEASSQEVIESYVQQLVIPNLKDLNEEATELDAAINTFLTDTTAANLKEAQEEWYDTREAWEQSEAMLFGPVVDNNFDPRIDSWPVDFTAIQEVWNSGNEFNQDYINGLADELKGFHPIEFLLFGQNGDAAKGDFVDARKVEYLKAMSLNLKRITDSLYTDWNPAAGNYGQQLIEAGSSSNKYNSKQAVMIEITNAMAGIVSEVGETKLAGPFGNSASEADPTAAESPFSQNSFTDFTNNIIGAQNVYLGGYDDDAGIGISAFVSKYNKNLDAQIKAKFKTVINNLKSYDAVPFGEAIINNRSQVQASIDALEDLKNILDTDLITLIQQYVKD